jgi:hypothetical protein
MEAGFYGIAALGSLMGGGVTDARACSLDGVVKISHPLAPYTVANEYICGRLATSVGLPAPPGTIAKLDDGTLAYVMLRFGLRGDKPPPADAAEVVRRKPRLAAGVVVFDDWIINRDRHSANLAYVAEAGLSIFDHGHALLGTTADGAEAHIAKYGAGSYFQGVLVPKIEDVSDLLRWANRLGAVPDELVEDICDTPYQLGSITRSEAKAAASILNERKRALWKHVDDGHLSFPAIKDWGLKP